ATRFSVLLSAGINLQSCRRYCRARKRGGSVRRALSMCAGDRDREFDLSQLEKGRPWGAQFCAGADGIVRHMVLPGRNKDRGGTDYRWGAEARLRRAMRYACTGRRGMADA